MRRRLKPLDIETMKRLGTRVNLIPVIAKADTMTPNDLLLFKERVSAPVLASRVRPLSPQGRRSAKSSPLRASRFMSRLSRPTIWRARTTRAHSWQPCRFR